MDITTLDRRHIKSGRDQQMTKMIRKHSELVAPQKTDPCRKIKLIFVFISVSLLIFYGYRFLNTPLNFPRKLRFRANPFSSDKSNELNLKVQQPNVLFKDLSFLDSNRQDRLWLADVLDVQVAKFTYLENERTKVYSIDVTTEKNAYTQVNNKKVINDEMPVVRFLVEAIYATEDVLKDKKRHKLVMNYLASILNLPSIWIPHSSDTEIGKYIYKETEDYSISVFKTAPHMEGGRKTARIYALGAKITPPDKKVFLLYLYLGNCVISSTHFQFEMLGRDQQLMNIASCLWTGKQVVKDLTATQQNYIKSMKDMLFDKENLCEIPKNIVVNLDKSNNAISSKGSIGSTLLKVWQNNPNSNEVWLRQIEEFSRELDGRVSDFVKGYHQQCS